VYFGMRSRVNLRLKCGPWKRPVLRASGGAHGFGRVIAEAGTHAALLASGGLYASLYREQLAQEAIS
jgi:hypothetical protein